MASETKHDNTFKFRMDDITLNLLERARSYIDLDKSKFIRQSIREKAEAIIAEYDQTRLSEDDWKMFFDKLDNPAPQTSRMKKAQEKYNDIVAKQ